MATPIVKQNEATVKDVKFERVPVMKDDGTVVFITRKVHLTSDGRRTRMYK